MPACHSSPPPPPPPPPHICTYACCEPAFESTQVIPLTVNACLSSSPIYTYACCEPAFESTQVILSLPMPACHWTHMQVMLRSHIQTISSVFINEGYLISAVPVLFCILYKAVLKEFQAVQSTTIGLPWTSRFVTAVNKHFAVTYVTHKSVLTCDLQLLTCDLQPCPACLKTCHEKGKKVLPCERKESPAM